jgi:hypothetical protein
MPEYAMERGVCRFGDQSLSCRDFTRQNSIGLFFVRSGSHWRPRCKLKLSPQSAVAPGRTRPSLRVAVCVNIVSAKTYRRPVSGTQARS